MRGSRNGGSARCRRGARVSLRGTRRLIVSPPRVSADCCGCRCSSAPGSAAYFALKVSKPPLWPGVIATIAGVVSAFALRRRQAWWEAVLAFTVFSAAGFALIREAASQREATMLQRRLGPVMVTGRVIDLDLLDKGWRLS